MSGYPQIRLGRALVSFFLPAVATLASLAPAAVTRQDNAATKTQEAPLKTEKKQPELPARIELLETHVLFEANGDSRKEVHTIVHINNELGARQFARIAFDYNRSFQQIEFPLLRITHAGGGTADILPRAVMDQPNAAVVNAPAYQDVRVKSVRLLGLAPGDTVEYRVVTTTTKHPLAPDFWLEHTFDRSQIVAHEVFDLDLPLSREVSIKINRATPAEPTDNTKAESPSRHYHWDRALSDSARSTGVPGEPDLVLTTFPSWEVFSKRISSLMRADYKLDPTVYAKAASLQKNIRANDNPRRALYNFVAQKITTIELPLGAAGFRTRAPADILRAGYGTAEDKCILLIALSGTARETARLALVRSGSDAKAAGLPRPGTFDQLLAVAFPEHSVAVWMDPAISVAPYGMIPSAVRGRPALLLNSSELWVKTTADLPFAASQNVTINAELTAEGGLEAKVRYLMRGDNELGLRVAFHQSSRDKWPEVAQLLALADGFRGKITRVSASDPYETNQPFSVEYEITQPKFIDWSKRPVRIPALLPQVGLPELPGQSNVANEGTKPAAIELGTPLAIETHLTLRLSPGTTAQPPIGIAVVRDYARFESKYGASGQIVTAERRLSFLERTIPGERAADYNAFIRAVQNDEAQEFTLQRAEAQSASASKDPSASKPRK